MDEEGKRPPFRITIYHAPGLAARHHSHRTILDRTPEPESAGSAVVRVLLSTWGSRGDVEPLLGLALELRAQGVEVRMCAPPDFAERVAEVGVPFVSLGSAVRELVASKPAPAQVAAMLVGQHFDVIGTVAQDCDAVVATGLMPA